MPENMKKWIKDSISEAVKDNQINPNSSETNDRDITKELKVLKLSQKELLIEKKASALTAEGAQSQFRVLSRACLKLDSAMEKLDDLSLSVEDPEEPLYQAISSIKEDISEAQDKLTDRLDSIRRADAVPNGIGWKALSKYEKLVEEGNTKNPEKDKLFSDCIKKSSEEKKKVRNKVTAPALAESLARFRFLPGQGSGGNNSTYSQGEITDSLPALF